MEAILIPTVDSSRHGGNTISMYVKLDVFVGILCLQSLELLELPRY